MRTLWIPTLTWREQAAEPWAPVLRCESLSPRRDRRVCEGAGSWPWGKPSRGCGLSRAPRGLLWQQRHEGHHPLSQQVRVSTWLCSMPVARWGRGRLANYDSSPPPVATDNGEVDSVLNFVSLIQDINEKREDERQHFTLQRHCLDLES